jgi:hypothetical protein
MSRYGPSRELVVEVCHTLLERGYLQATEGNVSVRVPGEAAYAITPSSYDYGKMEPGDICVLGLDGRRVVGTKKASIESSMHAAVYERRPDVSVIIHTHQPYASALALMERPIPALFDEQVRYLGRSVDLVPYAPSGTSFLKKNVAKRIDSGANAFILENHGVLVLGGDAEGAVHNMALLEKVALDYLLALLTDGRAETVPLPIREVAFRKLRKDEKRLARQVEEARATREAAQARAREAGRVEGEARATAGEPAPASASAVAAPAGAASPAGPSGAQLAGYSVSRYPDVADVYRRLDALVSQPLRPIRRPVMDDVLTWFDASCRRSKELTDAAMELIPGGVQHNLAFNYPFPLAMRKAEGAHLWDLDGNEYIDFLQAGGPTVLGSNYEPLRRQVAEVVEESGPVTGLFHEYELKLAELVNRLMPSCEMFRMLGSGTESVMAAIRAARTFTGKKWVVKVGGAYHGWSDQMVYGLHVPGTWRFEAKGIPFGATALTREVFPNDLDVLRKKLRQNQRMGGTAALIVEPFGPESGTRPVPFGFNAAVRELCDEFGALLIFDEVVTGFRVGLGGAQGYYGVRPDLTVFGKCITGGYPMAGGVGGRRDVMASFAGGIGGKTGERAYIGGTLSANPLSCAAGYFAITEMERTNALVLAGTAGDRLTAGLNRIVDKYGLPFVAYNQGSIVHLETSGVMLLDLKHPFRFAREMKPRKHMMEEMGAAFAANGLITLAGSRMYTSMADTDAVIDDALERFERVLSSVEGV